MTESLNPSLEDRIAGVMPVLAEHAREHDEDGSFAEASCTALKRAGLYRALVPVEFGGLGAGYGQLCDGLRRLAHACPSSALALSMLSHLVAATVYKVRKGQPGEALLRMVAEQGLVLVSTGAGDWLQSAGELTRVQGGYRFTATKGFCSGSPIGDLMITSGRYEDPEQGPRVLHFPLAYTAAGVTRGSDWNTHGMRATGSNATHIESAFVPDSAIAVDRPRGPWHPAFDVISTLALPILMSVYVGVAERAVELAVALARPRRDDPDLAYLAGELTNGLTVVQSLWRSHVDNAAEYDFAPDQERTCRSLALKTTLAQECIRTVEKAMEVAGGRGYFRPAGLEQLLRDVRAAHYHPMQGKRQQRFCGRALLGLSPVD